MTIGDGAVIGAGSIVTKDVEPYSIVAGVPCRFIRYRFEKDIRELLQKSKWWDRNTNIIKKVYKYMNNPTKFINELKIVEENNDT